MSVTELSGKLAEGSITLVDVRNAEDRAKASIAAARPLDDETMQALSQLPHDAPLAFICHHGNSSRGAAEHFRKQGFTQVFNVQGGMDAWSQEVDNTIPRY
ncbi:MAG TPA: rhodanese-like domain-containing protein, partial [Xanthomonadales bacterium]|nr:rhodanese-like domain-containing protein [Xanthomonadales bacterium]